jgi:DNA-binding MarR family transcriptional regulator
MKYEKEMNELRDLFLSIINKYKEYEKIPQYYGTNELLYLSEITTIETIGAYPEINVTDLAQKLGITKGAISQKLKKLEKKELVVRSKDPLNHKEVRIKLTLKGEIAFHQHQLFHLQFASEFFNELEQWTPEQMVFLKRVFTVFNQLFDKALKRPVLLEETVQENRSKR